MKSAFDKIAAGLDDAIAFAKGDGSRARVVSPVDVAAIRRKTKLTQAQFADAYHLPLGTIRDWEQQRSRPDSGSSVFLRLIDADPQAVASLVARAAA